MSVFKRTTANGVAWSSGATAWTLVSGTGTYPISAADQAIWDSTLTAGTSINAVTVTVGQIAIQNPAANQTIAVGTGAITLSPSAFSNVGIDMSSGTTTATNLTVAAALVLGSSQSWSVPSGRTLTVGVITSAAKDLTITGAGTTSIGAAGNAGSWTGSTIRASGGLLAFTDTRALGAATNSVVVDSGGAVRIDGTAGLGPSSFTVSGSGASGLLAGAIYFSSPATFAAGKIIALSGASPVILLGPTAAGGLIQGTPTSGDITFNITGTGANGATLTNAQTFTVPSGAYLVLQGANSVTGAAIQADFGLATSDANPFGAAENAVKVRSSLRLTNSGASGAALAVALSRNYFFDGESASGIPASPNTYSIAPAGNASSSFTFTGTVNGTPTNWVKASVAGGIGSIVQFGSVSGGKLNGSWNLRSFAATQTIYLHPSLDISTWTGALYAYRVSYGVAPTGVATYESGATLDNISGSTLTLAHSGYTLVGNLTFTGSAPMSLGGGNITTSASPTLTVSESTLTVPGTITGTGTFTKAAIGNLTLDGATSGYGTYAHTGGTLTLNSNNALGSSTAILTITAAVANTLDSTLGATLANTGANALNANFTWGGSADLTLGSGATSWNTARTISFLNGKTGTLKFAGNIGALGATQSLAVGGSPVGGSRSRLWLAGTNGMLALSNSVTAGYLRVSNSAGLGNAASTMWTVSSGAALELDGSISPTGARNVTITGRGPDTDGALRSVSGTNVWSGAIIPPVQSLASPTRIQVDAGTFTLSASGSPAYTTINPTVSGTPLQFTALGSTAVLNQPRQLTNTVSDVTINNGGVGTVVLSVANNHTGGTTVEGGTCKVTQINATSTGTVQVNASATLESTVQSEFTTLRLGTNGSGARAILKFTA
jgi:fibronectin-binding autotransporter adhesin